MSTNHNPLRAPAVVFKQGHYDKLRKVWPERPVTPEQSLAEIQYQAGVEAVLRRIQMEIEHATG